MRTTRLIALIASVAVATTVGCGGDDDAGKGTTSATSAPATTAATTTATPTPKGARNDPAPGRAVQAYFNALSRREAGRACTYMGASMKRAAVRFAKTSLKDRAVTTCAAALETILKPSSAADLRKIRDVEIISSTVEGIAGTVKIRRASRDALLTKTGDRWLITGGIFDG